MQCHLILPHQTIELTGGGPMLMRASVECLALDGDGLHTPLEPAVETRVIIKQKFEIRNESDLPGTIEIAVDLSGATE